MAAYQTAKHQIRLAKMTDDLMGAFASTKPAAAAHIGGVTNALGEDGVV